MKPTFVALLCLLGLTSARAAFHPGDYPSLSLGQLNRLNYDEKLAYQSHSELVQERHEIKQTASEMNHWRYNGYLTSEREQSFYTMKLSHLGKLWSAMVQVDPGIAPWYPKIFQTGDSKTYWF